MSVYVDMLEQVATWATARAKRMGKTCHMYADTPEELEEIARVLHLMVAWRHGDSRSSTGHHYDISPAMRARAVNLGAIEHSHRTRKEWMRNRKSGQGDPSHDTAQR